MQYIHENTLITTEQILPASQIGYDWEERFDKYLVVSARMYEFREQHPYATLEDIYKLQLTGASVEQARDIMLANIRAYDTSSAVNAVKIGGHTVWVDKDQRAALQQDFEDFEANGIETYPLWADGIKIDIPVSLGKQILKEIRHYAKQCFDVTQQHLADVTLLGDADMIAAYPYKEGYPPIPEFLTPVEATITEETSNEEPTEVATPTSDEPVTE